MPLYTRWEKTKPVPNRLTDQPSLEDRIPALLALVDEVVEVQQVPDNIGGTIAKKRPNWSGISAVLIRFAKNLKKSLD
jgi:ubiquinol-cytochrome c reductase cytochrome b subunit